MACYAPLKGYRSRELSESGRRKIVFDSKKGFHDKPVEVPCGQCIGCRLERSRQWAIRCMHEAQMHKNNCFITLTYDNDELPDGGTLVLEDFQKFMKRYRKFVKKPIRFFHCGEYGEINKRPHYHACIFGHDFEDRKFVGMSESKERIFTSEKLESIWNKGLVGIGDVTFKSAAYTARYIIKKVYGKNADEHYRGRKPEYVTMSRRPGIGKTWFEKFGSRVEETDSVVVNGREVSPPRYYDMLSEIDEFEMVKKKERRKRNFERHLKDNTDRRLRDRLKVKELQLRRLKREI